MKRKSIQKRKSKTRKYNMYGGSVPAPAPAFSGFGYGNTDLYTSLNNYLLAAHSIKLAANAIKDTSVSQNIPNTGTRNLQRISSASFSEASNRIQDSLTRLYQALNNNVSPTLTPATSPPPYSYSPPPM
jgi:hypothetical protein